MKRIFRFCLLTLGVAIIPLSSSPARKPPVIDVTKGAFEAIPLAIVPFETEGAVPAELKTRLHQILRFDLEFSGFFYLLPNRGQIAEVDFLDRRSEQINHAFWREIGADAVVKGKLRRSRNGEVEVELLVYYCKGAYRIIGKKFETEEKHFRRLVHLLSDEIVFNLTGNPGIARTRIAFVYETREGTKTVKELHLIDYDGHPESLRRLTRDRDIVAFPSWSPDGNQLAFTSYFAKNPDLYAIDLSTGRRRLLSRYAGLNISPTWHPSGKNLVLVLTKDGNSDLYRLDLRGNPPVRLTYDRSIESSPGYSPDGSRLVYTSDRGRSVQLYLMGADGRGAQRFSPSGGWYDQADWSPHGNRIVFIGSRDASRRFDLYSARPDGTEFRQLTRGSGSNEAPCWSPDGRHVLFNSNRDGNWNLYVMDADGKNTRRLTFLPGNCYSPAWSPLPE